MNNSNFLGLIKFLKLLLMVKTEMGFYWGFYLIRIFMLYHYLCF